MILESQKSIYNAERKKKSIYILKNQPPAGKFLRFGESKTRRNKVQNAFAEPVFVCFGRCAGHNVYGKSFNVTKNINYSSLYFFVFEHLKVTVCDVLQERNVPSTTGIITIYVKYQLSLKSSRAVPRHPSFLLIIIIMLFGGKIIIVPVNL